MTNPLSGIITSEFKTLFTNAIDALLENDALTRPCQFVYGDTKLVVCSNCIFNAITGRSTNRYKTGGPISFPDGQICPYCNGEGKVPTESTEDLYLMVIWDTNKWIKEIGGGASLRPSITVHSGDTKVQTLSKLSTTFAKIRRAKHLIIDTDIEDYDQNIFVREGDPEVLGFGNASYILTTWTKAG